MKSLGELLIRYPFVNAVAQRTGTGVLLVWPEGAEKEVSEAFLDEVRAALMVDAVQTLWAPDEWTLGEIVYSKNPRIKGFGWLKVEEKEVA